MFCYKSSQNSPYLKKFESIPFVIFCNTNIICRQVHPRPPNNCLSPTQSKHFKTGLYQGLANPCEIDRDFDINLFASVIRRQYTTLTKQCNIFRFN